MNMMNREDTDKIPMTAEGLAELRQEYDRLVNEKRPVVVERLSETRKMGDLAENSEYTQAREELEFVDGRITELKAIVDRAVLIKKVKGQCQEVTLGCKVVVKNEKQEHIFHIVGEWEANPTEQKISHRSPLGKSLLGKKVGDSVEVEAPAGKVIYTITRIE
jgi:transcription elongation factor GreA